MSRTETKAPRAAAVEKLNRLLDPTRGRSNPGSSQPTGNPVVPPTDFGVLLATDGTLGLFDPPTSGSAARDGGLVPETALLRKLSPTPADRAVWTGILFSGAWQRGIPRCCSRSWDRCCCGWKTAGCCRCCSKSPRGDPGRNRQFCRPPPSQVIQAANTSRRKRQLCACLA